MRRLTFDWHHGFQIEEHSIDKMKLWGTGQDVGDPVHAGVSVSQDSALRLSVVYRCIRLYAETLAAMPTKVVRNRGGTFEDVERTPGWMEQPNPETDWFTFADRIGESFEMDGNVFVLITARDALQFPAELWTLHPAQIDVRRENGRIVFYWGGSTRLSLYGPSNPGGDVLWIKGPTAGGLRGLSPIDLARQSIGLGLVAEKFGARFFGRGQTMSGVIQLPAASGAQTKEYIELMREQWEASHAGSDNSHRPGVLTGGATWQGITISPEEAQFLQSRSFQVEDIAARFYGVPPNLVGLTEKQTSWGTGVEAQFSGWMRTSILPKMTRLHSAFSSLLPRGQYFRFDPRHLLRGDSSTEADVWTKLLMYGVVNRDEVRGRYDLPPAPGGERFMVPGSQTILESSGLSAKPAASPQTQAPDGGADQMPMPVGSSNGNGG